MEFASVDWSLSLTEVQVSQKTSRSWPGAHVLSLDLRSLALVRIAYGFILFWDTVVRWTDIEAHYSDFGVLPRAQALEMGWSPYWLSLHMATGHVSWLNLFFLLQAGCALALLIGWKTRWMTVFSWILLTSIHSRNPMVLNGGDIYLRVFLFWMMFLPCGHYWSWDAKKGDGDHYRWMPGVKGSNIYGVSALAVTVQIASVYWFAAIPKTDPTWTVTYQATALTLKLDQFLTPLGYFFRENFAGSLALLTFLVLSWEAYGAFLLFFPFDRGQIRTFAVFGFSLMHLGFGTTMELGFFAWIGFATPLALLPSWFWDSLAKRPAAWANGRLGQGIAKEEDRCWSYPRETLFLFLLVYCFCWNMSNEDATPKSLRVPKNLLWIGHATRLDQRWNMFSPGPLTEDGWYVIEGRFKHGVVRDLFAEGKELSWEKPDLVSRTYKNERWRKYMMNLWLADNEKYRLPFGQYLCRKWNRSGRGPEELTNFDIVFMMELTNMDGSEAQPEKRVIWKHWCFDPPPSEDPPELELPQLRPIER